jgi:secreted trypsin-like serine protease
LVAPATWNADPSIPSVGDVGTLIGYGTSTLDGSFSPFLLKVDLDAISTAECRDDFSPITGFAQIEKNMVCARAEGKGICIGDAGAPILTPDGAIYGLGSFFNNRECGQSTSVFTRVSSFSGMIDSVSRDMRTHETTKTLPVGSSTRRHFSPDPWIFFFL